MEKVLDKGFVELIDYMGSDLTVVNAARVSFGKRKEFLNEDDKKLLCYLARNRHYSPFRHVFLQLHIKAPEFVMRQWYKHVVGIETTSTHPTKDHGWNEISGRYTECSEVYMPEYWRKQSKSNKQGSCGILPKKEREAAQALYLISVNEALQQYESLLERGVAKEQARILLPLSIYTEVWWTASFQALAHFIELRTDPHAQWEIRQYANVIAELLEEAFPESYAAWFSGANND